MQAVQSSITKKIVHLSFRLGSSWYNQGSYFEFRNNNLFFVYSETSKNALISFSSIQSFYPQAKHEKAWWLFYSCGEEKKSFDCTLPKTWKVLHGFITPKEIPPIYYTEFGHKGASEEHTYLRGSHDINKHIFLHACYFVIIGTGIKCLAHSTPWIECQAISGPSHWGTVWPCGLGCCASDWKVSVRPLSMGS